MIKNPVALKENEKGAVAIIIAISLTVLLGFTALVVDVGYLYEVRRQLQAAADAGALAGCQEMVTEESKPDVVALSEAMALEYTIDRNLAEEATATVDLADKSVTVVASRTVDLFFARIFGIFDKKVSAVAKAEVAYLVGVKDLDPMGVPNPKPKEVKVEVVDLSSGQVFGPYTLGGGKFVGDIYEYSGSIPVPDAGNYRIDVIRVNNQDFEEKLKGATALVVGSGAQVGEVKVNPNFITADVATSVKITAEVSGSPGTVEACWPKPKGNGQNTVTLQNEGGNVYEATASVNLPTGYPSDADGYGAYPVTMKIDGIESSTTLAYIVATDASVEVNDVDLAKNYIETDTQSMVSIDVKVQGFEYEKQYKIFLESPSYKGNSFSLDLDYAEFAPGTGEPDSPTEGKGNGSGKDSIRDALAGLLHADPWAPTHLYHYYKIGDYVWTEPGCPTEVITQGIEARIKDDSCTWDSWKNNTSPTNTNHTSKHQCKHLMTVALIEETGLVDLKGKSKPRIVGFAQFFVEKAPTNKEPLYGRFVKYVKGGMYQKTPPPEPNIKTIHLVKPDDED